MRRVCAVPALVVLAAVTSVAFGAPQDPTSRREVAPLKLEDTPTLTVQGRAELRKAADEVRLSVGVVSEGEEAADALRENSRSMNAVVDALRKAGLGPDEYETGRFQIRPRYAQRPRPVPQGWKPKIVGYEVVNSVRVRTRKLDRTGKIIEQANVAGANSVEVTGFGLADPRQHRPEAIVTATRHARTDAATLAEAAGVRLVRTLRITLDRAPKPRAEFGAAARGMAADGGATPPIEPGHVLVQAGVTIVYEIAPSE